MLLQNGLIPYIASVNQFAPGRPSLQAVTSGLSRLLSTLAVRNQTMVVMRWGCCDNLLEESPTKEESRGRNASYQLLRRPLRACYDPPANLAVYALGLVAEEISATAADKQTHQVLEELNEAPLISPPRCFHPWHARIFWQCRCWRQQLVWHRIVFLQFVRAVEGVLFITYQTHHLVVGHLRQHFVCLAVDGAILLGDEPSSAPEAQNWNVQHYDDLVEAPRRQQVGMEEGNGAEGRFGIVSRVSEHVDHRVNDGLGHGLGDDEDYGKEVDRVDGESPAYHSAWLWDGAGSEYIWFLWCRFQTS